jgi:hypothetical protein
MPTKLLAFVLRATAENDPEVSARGAPDTFPHNKNNKPSTTERDIA